MLRLKRLPIDTHHQNVAYLYRGCTGLDAESFLGPDKVEIRHGDNLVVAVLNIVDDVVIVAPDELGLSSHGFAALGVPEGATVTLNRTHRPPSQAALRRKVAGAALDREEMDAVVADIVANRYSGREIAAFLVAAVNSLTDREVTNLARARAAHAPRIDWGRTPVVDKHSMGGIPGNRVTMLVVPIVAAHGLTIPKTSSRAITSAAGTADTMEVLARVDLTPDEVRDVVSRTGGCIVWNGRLTQSPVDDVMNFVTRPLALNSHRLSVASILSKKLAAGSTHVIIDMPVGPTAKVPEEEAVELARLFETTGENLGLKVKVQRTPGDRPIGRGVGPALEARDVMAVLRGDPEAPADLREKSLDFAATIIAFDGVTEGAARARAAELLASGQAATAMEHIIEAQGAAPRSVAPGPLVHEVAAPVSGTVSGFDNYRLNGIARGAGAPMDKAAGLDLLVAVGEKVKKGQPFYRIHASTRDDFDFAIAEAAADCGVRAG